MLNVVSKLSKDGKKLVIEVDLTKEFGFSKSGKTIIIGSSQGNQAVGNGVVMGLNVYKYPEKGVK